MKAAKETAAGKECVTMEKMECKEMLNEAQAEALFYSNAVFIDVNDVIAVDRVVDLLGVTPVAYVEAHANRSCKGSGESSSVTLLTSWKAEGQRVEFMTYHGFLLAVTYHNTILQEEKENHSKAAQA